MKKLIAAILCITMLFSLSGCGIAGLIADSYTDASDYDSDMTPEDIFRDIRDSIDSEKLVAFNVKVHNDLEDGQISLSADLKNKQTYKVTDITVAFAAWDIDGNPIKLKSASGATEDSYIKEVGFGDNSIEANGIWKADKGETITGFKVDKTQTNIAYVAAIAVSFEKEDGAVWENPYYQTWCESYEGEKLESYMNLKSVYDALAIEDEE